MFFSGKRFAGQRRLLNVEIVGCCEARVRRNQISGGQPDDVSRDHVATANFFPLSTPQRRCRGGNLAPQFFNGVLRTIGLTEVHSGTQQNNDADDRGIHDLTQKSGCNCGGHQDQHQRVHEHMQKIGTQGMVLRRGRLVRPELRQACRRLRSRRPAAAEGVGFVIHRSNYHWQAVIANRIVSVWRPLEERS